MPFNVGPLELIIVLAIALIVLGPKKLPEFGKSIGSGMREFKDSLTSSSTRDEDEDPARVKP
jgi:sec-independent protein translocase protein TatA